MLSHSAALPEKRDGSMRPPGSVPSFENDDHARVGRLDPLLGLHELNLEREDIPAGRKRSFLAESVVSFNVCISPARWNSLCVSNSATIRRFSMTLFGQMT
jgi:hypothetical protein